MSKKKIEEIERTRVQKNKKVEVKTVYYGTERLVDCMKAVIRIHMNSGSSIAGGGYE